MPKIAAITIPTIPKRNPARSLRAACRDLLARETILPPNYSSEYFNTLPQFYPKLPNSQSRFPLREQTNFTSSPIFLPDSESALKIGQNSFQKIIKLTNNKKLLVLKHCLVITSKVLHRWQVFALQVRSALQPQNYLFPHRLCEQQRSIPNRVPP